MNNLAKISIKELYKSFGKKIVLNGVNLSVNTGERLVVIGGSGSGKSVLIKTIIGLIQADSGIIEIDSQNVTNLVGQDKSIAKKFGFLFQGGALFDSLPVWRNIAFGLIEAQQMNYKNAQEIAINKLSSVGLDSSVANLYPAELSGGMQKRVALARAIACDPEIIFFDEPTTGLDPIMANIIDELIIKCSEELGVTTITITHDMNSARKIADKVAMLYQGKIIWTGPAKDLDHSNNIYVEQFTTGNTKGPITSEIQGY